MSIDNEPIIGPTELSPIERINLNLATIMGDPERIMGAECPPLGGDGLPLPPPEPRPDQEAPLTIPDDQGRPLATFQTLPDPQTGGPLVVLALFTRGTSERFTYRMADGFVTHMPAYVHDAELNDEAAKEALATSLEGLADRWSDLYSSNA